MKKKLSILLGAVVFSVLVSTNDITIDADEIPDEDQLPEMASIKEEGSF